MKALLSIAGFDPSSGAGISQDLDAFRALGFHGLSVQTALVSQGPRGVTHVAPVSVEKLSRMLSTLVDQVPIAGVKIGVVLDEEQARCIRAYLEELGDVPVVLDPVLAAKNGRPLSGEAAVRYLVSGRSPPRPVITPNLAEASRLLGREVGEIGGMKEAARSLHAMGPQAVVVTGGHLEGDPVDVLFDGSEVVVHHRRRVSGLFHGTGCLFSSLLLGLLSRGLCAKDALRETGAWMDVALSSGYALDEGGYRYLSLGLVNSGIASGRRLQQRRHRSGAAEEEAGRRDPMGVLHKDGGL